jgi:teichuronic acid exporter
MKPDPNVSAEITLALNTPQKIRSTTEAQNNLDNSLIRSVAWSGAAKWSSQILNWAATLIIARILTPYDYGLVSLASVYLGVLTLVTEFGLGSSVVVIKGLSGTQVAELNSLSVLMGVAGFLVSCAIAVPLGHFFNSPQLPLVVVVMSLGFIISSFQTIPNALLQRELRFKLLSLIGGANAATLAIVMVVFAFLGFGYWTLVLGALFGTTLSTILTLALQRHTFALPRLNSVGPAIRFSWQVLISRLAWYAYSNADFVVAGRLLSAEALGNYTLAWNLANAPLEKVTSLVGSVTPAFYSAVRENLTELHRYLLRPTEAISLITFPVMIGLALVTNDAVLVLLGPKWIAAIPALRLLAIYACIRSIMPLPAQVLMVIGDARFVMWNGIVSTIILPVAFVCGSHWGITGIAAAWAVAYPVNALPIYWRLRQRISLSNADVLRALAPATTSAAFMAIVVMLAKLLFPQSGHPLRLAIQVAAGIVSYSLSLFLWHRNRVVVFWSGLSRLRGEG